ncbi:mitochondrial carrier domain-containing protein, putative [Eimeria necatrix]|uniref:Mitochondrial carrier domain-containing protein, putative n=1 Tax=Eimeria necatrix TaxID=51315 RepID=U6MKL6_9EIME|nr:mitochondrial carrier domain-containing protein, putative [Eimeria necatrix]CDJ64797.1 mitochondrial carrier domain-containing protein, putative [Eimeria necatrix]
MAAATAAAAAAATGEEPLRYPWLPADQQRLPATMASASMAGLLSRLVMHPLDTAKAVIQVQTKTLGTRKWKLSGSKTALTLSSIWKADGVAGLYRGFAVTSALAVPATCLYFSTYEILKSRFLKLSRGEDAQSAAADQTFLSALLLDSVCGFSAEAISCVFYLPMDVCKERLQQFGKIANSLRGSDVASPKSPTAECCPLIDASVAGAAAGAAAFLTAPLDKVKLRLQVQMENSQCREQPFYYRNFFHGLASLFRSEGLRGCFAGVGARTLFHSGSLFMTFLFMQTARNVYCRYYEA